MRDRSVTSRCVLSLLGGALLAIAPASSAWGQRGAVFGDLIRKAARVSDDIPLRRLDEVVEDIGRSQTTREAVESEIRQSSRALEEAGKTASRSERILELLRKSTTQLDPSLLRRIELLDEGSREAALVLVRGGEHLRTSVPDLAVRSRFLRDGGPETVAAVGALGPDAARAAARLDEAIRAGSVVVREASRPVALADFGRVMSQGGKASWDFWRIYVQPHWKVWIASGALAAYLADPKEFQDAAGRLTESGFKRLTELAGSVAAAAIRGVGQGSGRAAEDVTTALAETFLTGPRRIYAIIGTAILVLGLTLSFRRVRHSVMKPIRWLLEAPGSKPVAPRGGVGEPRDW